MHSRIREAENEKEKQTTSQIETEGRGIYTDTGTET